MKNLDKKNDEVQETFDEEVPKIGLFIHGKSLDFGLLIVVFILLTVGLVMMFSASAPYSLRTEGDSYYYFEKQLLFVVIGIVVMLLVSHFDYRLLNSRISWLAYVAGLRHYGTCFSTRHWCRA